MDRPRHDASRTRADASTDPGETAGNESGHPEPLLELDDVTKVFAVGGRGVRRKSRVQAVSGVSLRLLPGETLGLVGESGSGKSTLGRLALRLVDATSGEVRFDGEDVTRLSGRRLRAMRRDAQVVFQDPYAAFDPLLPLEVSVREPLEVHTRMSKPAQRHRLEALLPRVGLSSVHLDRYPRELSGGQLQRMAIARALAVGPRLVVLDEPVSSLDVSTQAQVINLLETLQRDLDIAYLFIAHDPALVRHASDRLAVMYLGEIVEAGPAGDVYEAPKHPYTQALLSAMAVPDPEAQRSRRRIVLHGDVPNPADPPTGCRFHPRCPHAMDLCVGTAPPVFETSSGSTVRCHLHTAGPRLAGRPITDLGMPSARDSNERPEGASGALVDEHA